ncbi:MAG: ABC transporter ATP-binding protein [Pseudomonadota bacterium]
MSQALLRAEKLTKRFAEQAALLALDLSVDSGEVVCLLGANGAGKTTTINLFLGFLHPDEGKALVEGIEVAVDPIGARRRLAYLPESVALYPMLTGLENLTFFDSLGNESPGSQEQLRQILTDVGLAPQVHDRRASTYSKGMRQKVGIAIAVARGARALLLDEPLSGLDPEAANGLGELITRLRGEGCAVLMATHDIFRAKEVGDRIGIMAHGRLLDTLRPSHLDAREIEQIYLSHLREATAVASDSEAVS